MSLPASIAFVVRPGRAVLVSLTGTRRAPEIVLRHELHLADTWVRESLHPYHRELGDSGVAGRRVRQRGCTAARRATVRAIRRLVREMRSHGYVAHAVALVEARRGDPSRSTGAHERAHAEKRKLYQDAVRAALDAGDLAATTFVDAELAGVAAKRLSDVAATLRAFSHEVGTPWRAPEKHAALAAWLGLPARVLAT